MNASFVLIPCMKQPKSLTKSNAHWHALTSFLGTGRYNFSSVLNLVFVANEIVPILQVKLQITSGSKSTSPAQELHASLNEKTIDMLDYSILLEKLYRYVFR